MEVSTFTIQKSDQLTIHKLIKNPCHSHIYTVNTAKHQIKALKDKWEKWTGTNQLAE